MCGYQLGGLRQPTFCPEDSLTTKKYFENQQVKYGIQTLQDFCFEE